MRLRLFDALRGVCGSDEYSVCHCNAASSIGKEEWGDYPLCFA